MSACLLGAASSAACVPPLAFDVDASIVPRALPAAKTAPVGLEIQGTIRQGDYPPSALRETVIEVDKDIEIDVEGLPTCRRSQLAARDVPAARRVCRSSIVGRGRALVVLHSTGERIPLTLTLFNGHARKGVKTLFIHSHLTVPVPAVLIGVVAVRETGGDGLEAVLKVPPIAGGSGALLDFEMDVQRSFAYERTVESFLAARCPDGVFRVSSPKNVFRNEAGTPGVAATTIFKGGMNLPCTARAANPAEATRP